MRKYSILIISLTLIMAALACNLPAANQAQNSPEAPEPTDAFRTETRLNEGVVVGILLPESYYVGESEPDLSSLLESLQDVGVPPTVDLTALLDNSKEDILMWGYDTGSSSGIPASFVVIKNDEFGAMPLGIISTFAGNFLGDTIEILEQDRLTIANRETLRWITVTKETGYASAQVVYLFKDSGTLYIIVFNVDYQVLNEQRAVFDSIVASLTITDLE